MTTPNQNQEEEVKKIPKKLIEKPILRGEVKTLFELEHLTMSFRKEIKLIPPVSIYYDMNNDGWGFLTLKSFSDSPLKEALKECVDAMEEWLEYQNMKNMGKVPYVELADAESNAIKSICYALERTKKLIEGEG